VKVCSIATIGEVRKRLDEKEGSLNVQESLKEVMRAYPQGVTVVTAKANGKLWGMTASSFICVSLEPPLVLVSMMKNSVTYEAFVKANFFAINLLGDDQKSVSDRFAGRVSLKDRFEGLKYHVDISDAPIIQGVIGYIECRKWREYDGGDHTLMIGEVINAKKLNRKSPLIYYAQQYTSLAHPEFFPTTAELMW
jgi:flavin reductase (DIM6/NTAB) family NADH-FMN oxidoreductase RutF